MFKQKVWMFVLVPLLLVGGVAGTVAADSSSSAHYRVTETQFGAGGDLHDCSANYCAKTSAGETAVGNTKSTNYQAQGGFNTDRTPFLEVSVSGGAQNLGYLDTDTTATATMHIKVRNYLSSGYVMQIAGAAPSQVRHTLTTLATPTTSHPGAEQFGINLVDNTTPDVGANPVQVPDNTYSFGQVAPDYSTPDLFKYVPNDIVAQSNSSSGETDYTLSMILNVSRVTPGGHYDGNYSAVVVSTF